MPKLDPGFADRQAERLRRYDEAMAANADDRARAIDNCTLCDADGYRNGRICHHDPAQDDINRRGAAACRAALSKLPRS